MRSKTYLLALNGVIAAAYAALTLVAAALNLAYGPVQFRFSEALTVLPFLFPGTWPGVFVGAWWQTCSAPTPAGRGPGSAGTLVAALLTQKAPKTWLAPLPPGGVRYGTPGRDGWPGMRWAFPTSSSPSSQPMRCGWASPGGVLLWAGAAPAAGSAEGLLLPPLHPGRPPGPSACGLNRKKTAASPARGEAAALILGRVFPRPHHPVQGVLHILAAAVDGEVGVLLVEGHRSS